MIVGHYASALWARSRDPRGPFALFLACAILQDAAWLALAALGYEPTLPASVLDASFRKVSVEMTFSHDLVSASGWMLIAGTIGLFATRRWQTALLCCALSFGHEVLDLACGFAHHVAGPTTRSIGFNLYGNAPYLAILLEAAFGALMVALYGRSEARRGRPLSRHTRMRLVAVFVVGALVALPGAERSFHDWMG